MREKYAAQRGETVHAILDEAEKALKQTPRYALDCCEVYELYQRECGGNIRETARRMNRPRSTIQSALERHRRHATEGTVDDDGHTP